MKTMSSLMKLFSLNKCSSQAFRKTWFQHLRQSPRRYCPHVRGIYTCTILCNSNDMNTLPKNKKDFANKKVAFTWKNLIITSTAGAVFLMYMYYLQATKDKEIDRERRRELGKAAIGGRFELVDPNGKTVKSEDFLGQWVLLYFGFTHCPDICPDELEKLTQVVNTLEKEHSIKAQPIFISVDPDRDTPEIVGKYIKEFSDKILGLTGGKDQVAKVCKAYRVYYSSGPKDQDSDYIVDHTIIIYLVDPDGLFVDYYGLTHSAEQIVHSVTINKMKYDNLKSDSWIPSISMKSPLPA